MPGKARRPLSRPWDAYVRRALLALCLWLAGAGGALACRFPPHLANDFRRESFVMQPGCDGQWQTACAVKGITAAWYEMPTGRYAHGVLGDAIEGGRLTVYTDATSDSCGTKSITLDAAHVFEDTAPRLADLDGDGDVEVITVRSHRDLGAQLAIWDDNADKTLRLIAATPYIGMRNRWLAPLGAADLDGDGQVEIAYVDRPHLVKTLRIWRYAAGALTEVATFPGVTNHRIGETDIAGGLRDCAGGPEMIVADSGWQSMLALRFDGSGIEARRIGTDTSRAAFALALSCR